MSIYISISQANICDVSQVLTMLPAIIYDIYGLLKYISQLSSVVDHICVILRSFVAKIRLFYQYTKYLSKKMSLFQYFFVYLLARKLE